MQEPDTSPPPDGSQRMGRGMLWVAALLMLGGLTWLFSGLENAQRHPNQGVSALNTDGYLEVRLDPNRAGHYVAEGAIGGEQVTYLVDTGASYVAVSAEQAERFGLRGQGSAYMRTANGEVEASLTRIPEMEVAGIRLQNVRAVIMPNMGGEVLLGMNALNQIDWQRRDGQLILRQASG